MGGENFLLDSSSLCQRGQIKGQTGLLFGLNLLGKGLIEVFGGIGELRGWETGSSLEIVEVPPPFCKIVIGGGVIPPPFHFWEIQKPFCTQVKTTVCVVPFTCVCVKGLLGVR